MTPLNVSPGAQVRCSSMLVALALSAIATLPVRAAGDDEQKPAAVVLCQAPAGKECQIVVTAATLAKCPQPERKGDPPWWELPVVVLIVGGAATAIAGIMASVARAIRRMSVDAEIGKLALREMAPKGGAAMAMLRAHSAAIIAIQKNAKEVQGAAAERAASLARACEEFSSAP